MTVTTTPQLERSTHDEWRDRRWRLTRWAWGWFVLLAGPLGCAAYLLLGGPLGVARPRNPSRRVTGGWAFLLAMFFFGGSNAA
jgi:lipopolysaccharide export LptBFGC system permease protein LptF